MRNHAFSAPPGRKCWNALEHLSEADNEKIRDLQFISAPFQHFLFDADVGISTVVTQQGCVGTWSDIGRKNFQRGGWGLKNVFGPGGTLYPPTGLKRWPQRA